MYIRTTLIVEVLDARHQMLLIDPLLDGALNSGQRGLAQACWYVASPRCSAESAWNFDDHGVTEALVQGGFCGDGHLVPAQ